MFVDEMPQKKLGILSPRYVSDNGPYEFYRLAPPGVMLVSISCGLEKFTVEDVERVFKPLDYYLDMLMERNVDIISQTGVPLPCVIGTKAHDALLARIEKYTGKPATSQLNNVLAALKHLKLKNILVVNKWTDKMNETLEEFLDRDGINCAGVYNKSLTPAEFSKIKQEDSAKLAYDLAMTGLKDHPEADGVFIGGGNWLSQPVCEQLERETGKPIICNLGAMVWHLCRFVGMWKPIQNHGKLLAQA
jgi:maleate cis-trans isomerase